MMAPATRHTLRPRNCAKASTTMLAPMAQITCMKASVLPPNCSSPPGDSVMAVEMIAISTKISQRPRVSRNRHKSPALLRATMSPALVPDSSTNTGAQKCVIQRVSASTTETFSDPIGSMVAPA